MKALFKGAKLREVNQLERMAIAAIWHSKAQNIKKISVKKLFDADKLRRKLEKKEQRTRNMYTEHYDKAHEDLKQYFKKGG